MIALPSIVVSVALTIASAMLFSFLALTAIQYARTRDAEKAARTVSESFFGVLTGAVLAAAVFVGELVTFLTVVVGTFFEAPAVLVGAIGLGGTVKGASPGIVLIGMVVAFLLARAVDGRNA